MGTKLKNIFGFALGAEWGWGHVNELFGEILGNTAASANYILPSVRASVGLSVDNNGALL